MIADLKKITILILLLTYTAAAAEMYWVNSFSDINLPPITIREQSVQASSTITLYTDGNCEISADNSTAAQLSNGFSTLVTLYKLSFDGNGSSATGASDTDLQNWDQFLSTPTPITHVSGDNEVTITMTVQAENHPDQLADAGTYTATQTLTVYWTDF